MPLVPMGYLLREAEKDGYAVGAFNCSNMEILQAIIRAAQAENSPVILQVSEGAIKYAGLEYLVAMAKLAAKHTSIPVALHLDHGTDLELIEKCIQAGFTSIMYDGSHLPLKENADITRRLVETSLRAGFSVEAELGRISGTEEKISVTEKEAFFTDPEEARYFVSLTGVDALAVSIGTAHGHYRGEPKLDFERLSKIHSLIPTPIVLHGSSGVPEEAIQEAIKRGARKINIDTDIREAFIGAIRRELTNNLKEIDPRKILGPAREDAMEVVRNKIRLFGSSGKAAKM
jgi:fructose-bisphosphate aldolase class II